MFYPTLKANKEHDIDIVWYYEEFIGCIAYLFDDDLYNNKYVDERCSDYTDLDKLEKDFSKKEIERIVWKRIKEEFQYATKGDMFRYGDYVFDLLDCDDIVYRDVEDLIKKGILKRSDIFKIKNGIEKKGYSITVEERYGENNIYCRFFGLGHLADKYFPCLADDIDGCKDCGNCD